MSSSLLSCAAVDLLANNTSSRVEDGVCKPVLLLKQCLLFRGRRLVAISRGGGTENLQDAVPVQSWNWQVGPTCSCLCIGPCGTLPFDHLFSETQRIHSPVRGNYPRLSPTPSSKCNWGNGQEDLLDWRPRSAQVSAQNSQSWFRKPRFPPKFLSQVFPWQQVFLGLLHTPSYSSTFIKRCHFAHLRPIPCQYHASFVPPSKEAECSKLGIPSPYPGIPASSQD